MKTKRILSILLAVAMLLTLIPTTVLADSGKDDKHDHKGEDDGIHVKIEAGKHGKIDSPSSQNEPAPGEVWTFTAVPDDGYRFVGWTFNGNEVPGAFSAADNPVLTVSFSQRGTWIDGHWEGIIYVFGHWDYAEYRAQAVFEARPVYNLSVSANDPSGGSVRKNPNKTSFYGGDDVTLTATPASSAWEFTGWSGDASGNVNPLTVTMNSSKTIVANFARIPRYTLGVSTVGSGSVSKNPNAADYLRGDSVTLTATPSSADWEFAGWSGDATGMTNPLTVGMNGNKNIVANFTRIPRYTLNVTTVGSGTVTKNPNAADYLRGDHVDLTAVPAEGWQFDGWSGDASGKDISKNVVMDGNKSITATFTKLPEYTLTVTPPTGGTVSKDPDWASYYQGKDVTLTATPSAGYRFGSWSGDASGTSNTTTVNMNGNKTVTANFIQQYLITLNDPAGGHYDNEGAVEGWRDSGASINLGDANPDADNFTLNKFIGWRDDLTGQMVSNYKSENYTFTLTGNRTFTAMYGDIEGLYVGVNEPSRGYLANDISGMYGRGAVVDLNDAQPTAKRGWTFSHWEELRWGEWEETGNIITIGDSNWFRAVFEQDQSTVSFDENGGTPAVPDQTVLYNNKASRPDTVMTKTGYTFVNWYADPACTTLFDFNTRIKADTVVYAKWNPIHYTVAYDSNGGTGYMAPSSYTYDQSQKLAKNIFVKDGCAFAGWTCNGTAYSDEQSVSNLTAVDNSTVTMRAKWNVSGVNVIGYDREYDGAFHGVSVTGTADATVSYSVGDESHYGPDAPTYKDVTSASGVRVYVKVERDEADPYITSVVIKITKATLTVRAEDKSVTYGSNPPSYTAVISGYKGTEGPSVISGTPALSCSYAKGNGVGNYTITAGAGTLSATNYTFSCVNGTLAVGAKELTVTADDKSVTYGDAAPKYTAAITGFINEADKSTVTGEAALSCVYAPSSGVGDYVITAGVGTLAAPNYTFKAANGKLTVGAKGLTVTADNKSVTYGAAAPVYTATITGFVNGENESIVTGSPALSCSYRKGNGIGNYTITAGVGTLAAPNYTFSTFINGTLAVGTKELTVTADNMSIVYGDAAPVYTATITGFVDGDNESIVTGTPALSCLYAPGRGVGDYTITAGVGTLAASNYTFKAADGKLTVGAKELTVTADNKSVTYGDAAPKYTSTITGFVNSENESIVTGIPELSSLYAPGSGVGDYVITAGVGTLAAPNYTFKPANGKLTVGAKELTVTADNKSVTYGDAAPKYTAVVTGFVNSENESIVTGLPELSSLYAPGRGVGDYTITAGVGTLVAPNYSFKAVDGKLTVGAKELIVTADNKSVIYGDAAPGYTATVTGFVNGENNSIVTGSPELSSLYAPGSGVGGYTITAGVGTLAAPNYTFKAMDGKLTVGAKELTVTADNKTVTYGDAVPGYTATIAGFVNREDESVVTGLPALSCLYAPGSGVGDYTITAGVGTLASQNYTFKAVDGKLTVGAKELTVTADSKSVIYGAAAPGYTATITGFVNSENASIVTGSPVLTCPYVLGNGAKDYAITAGIGTLAAPNYTFKAANGTLTVGKAPLTVTADDKTVTFLDASPTYTAQYSGFVAGDDAADLGGTMKYTCAYAAGSAVGTYPITPSGLTSNNYAFTFKPGTLTVKTLMLTVNFVDYNNAPLGSSTVAYGTPASAPANPTREGYTFTGWSTSFNSVTASITVSAQYKINQYTVRFFGVDGVTEIGTPQTINYDGAASFPTAPARTGYAFDQWVLTGDNAAYADSLTHVKENINAVASYIRNGYTVTFVDYDGAVIGTDGVLYGQGANAPVPPTRAGYTFAGWDRDFDPVTGNITVTARYTINRYTVTFVDYNGDVIDTQTVDYNTAAVAPTAPARDGYEFTGWDTTFDAVTSDMTVTAQYQQIVALPSEGVPQTGTNIPEEPVPSTGGSAFAWWWIVVAVVGAGLLFFLIFFVWKRRRDEEEEQ